MINQVEIDFSTDLNGKKQFRTKQFLHKKFLKGTQVASFPGRWKPKLIPTKQTPKPETNKVNDDDKIGK